jgi:type I restriction enzyme S subunit
MTAAPARWPAYPAYKPSGLPWLGDIPAHWEAASIRRYCKAFAGATPSRDNPEYWENGTIPWLASGDVNLRRITQASQFITEAGFKASSTKWIKPGSVVVALAGQGKTKGMVATVEIDTTCNQSLGVLEPQPQKSDYRFLAFYLESRYLDIRGLVGNDLRDGLNLDHLLSIPTPLPPLPEQRAIAAFLDRETAKIDTLIAKKERLIELLDEKRTALISRAVTKGLDPAVPMKDSGVAWLGEVPKVWEVKRLGIVAPLQRGHDLTTSEHREGIVPVISSSGISGFHDIAQVKGPGVVTGRYGTIGQIYYVETDYWPMNTTLYVYDFKGNYPRYIYHLLSILPFDTYSGKSAVPGVDRKDLNSLAVVCPPHSEQEDIATYLDNETAKVDTLIARVQDGIERLREYRAALIAAAVTGKIDVRAVFGP